MPQSECTYMYNLLTKWTHIYMWRCDSIENKWIQISNYKTWQQQELQ